VVDHLSDQPVVRAPEQPFWNFSGSNFKPINPPASPAPLRINGPQPEPMEA
jgi:hypothetical protein